VSTEDFVADIDESPEKHRPDPRRLYDWAVSLEYGGLVMLSAHTTGKLIAARRCYRGYRLTSHSSHHLERQRCLPCGEASRSEGLPRAYL
jgi:hypothetical protein